MDKTKMADPQNEQNQAFFDREQQQIFNIITGRIRYKPQPFRDEDLHPDLIIKIKVPKSQYIPRGKYQSLSNFIPAPSQKLERVYARAQKEINSQMEINKENLDPHNIQIRLQKALRTINPEVKQVKLINENDEQEIMELQCINKTNGLIDAFTIQYNAMIYTLQKVCGFRVKAFVLYGKEAHQRDIYLFLNMNTDNLLRVANKYRIKKEVDYTFIDFYLNDPTTRDDRPIKFNSKFKSDKHSVIRQKHLKRYFKVKQGELKETQIVEELELSDNALQNFRSCNEELHIVYDYIKYKQHFKLTKSQKTYIFEYNRRKINPGVQKLFHTIKKRREYFDISKEILPKYGYKVWDEPTVFEEFSLPDKNSKGATFFNKFQSVMFYKPLVVSKEGNLSLFLNMERTKLAYMLIKKTFKVNYLTNIGVDIFPIENEFQKYGSNHGAIRGGIDGECLIDKWNFYSLFSDYKVIRNYVGQKIAYQILSTNYIISYLLSIFIPYIFLEIIEQTFSAKTYIITTPIEALIFTISYSILISQWQIMEGEFVKNYCDPVESKVFLSRFRGAYKRNVVTDEVNEFQNEKGSSRVVKNLICFVILVVLAVILGAIFYGFRMMIIEIYEPLSAYVSLGTISLPHTIAYFLYFIFSEMFRVILAQKIISVMVFLQNPPSDEDERQWQDVLTFFYVLIIDLIPPIFLLILEPFSGTSCYNDSCIDQLTYYVYAKYSFIFAIVFVRLGKLLILNYLKNKLKQLIKEEKHQDLFFQDKLTSLLKKTVADSKKPQHREDKMSTAVSLMNYAIYNCDVPLSAAIMLISVFIHFTNLRMALLYDQRRPVNKSESIIRFTKQIMYIYYLGIIFSSWINIFLLETTENYFQDIITGLTTLPTEQGLFLIKFITTIVFGLIIVIVGGPVGQLARAISNNSINNRKDHKLYEYKTSRGGLKIILKKSEEMIPIKSIFRVSNPERTNEQLLEEQIYNSAGFTAPSQANGLREEEGENVGSATNLAKNLD